jgi:predicted ATPase
VVGWLAGWLVGWLPAEPANQQTASSTAPLAIALLRALGLDVVGVAAAVPRRVRRMRPAMLADDFAPHVTPAELAVMASSVAAMRPVVVMSAVPAHLVELRSKIDPRRVEVLLRELVVLMRRSLRGTDAVALAGDELLLLVDGPMLVAQPIAARLLAAVRTHRFTGGITDQPIRVTLSLGAAAAPEHGGDFDQLVRAARRAQAEAGVDNATFAQTRLVGGLDLERFVGRAEPLARLSESLDDMSRGVARVVAVIGESGVGSSSLVQMLGPEVRLRGGSLVSAACHEQRLPEPYALWSEVLRSVRRLPVKSTRAWRELSLLDASLERAPEELTRGGSKVRLLEELADFLRLAAQQRPLLILLDDMQWADAASWDALEHIVPQLESERIVLALTIRTGEQSDDALERWSRMASRPHHDELRMTRLTRDDVKRWVEGAMSHGEAGRDLLAYLYRHTEGNPLHVAHLLRDLEEAGHLAREGGRWRWSDLQELPSGVTFTEIVSRRAARLPSCCTPVLELVATLDREFDETFLKRAGGRDEETFREGIACLVDARILTPTYDRDCASYQFSHDEVARVVRESLPAERQAEMLARVASALAMAGASHSLIASHYEAAGDSVATHEHAVLAADAALGLYDSGAASALLTVAARHAPSPAALASVRMRLAELAEAAGHYEDAEALCDLALNWFEGEESPLQAIRLKRMRTLVRMRRGQGARETLDALFALVEDATLAGADVERASILLMASQMLARIGEFRKAEEVAEDCLAIAERCEDPILLADSYNRVAVSNLLSDTPRARRLFDKAIALVVPLGDSLRHARFLNNVGILDLMESRWSAARETFMTAVEFSRTTGLTEQWGRAALNLGVLAIRTADFSEAPMWLSEALRLSAEAQNSEIQLIATYNLASLARDTGELVRARNTYELAKELAERIGQTEILAGSLAGVALCELDLGRIDEARTIHRILDSQLASLTEWFQGRELVEALTVRLALLDGRDEAAQLFTRAVRLADTRDAYGAVLLTAEFGEVLREAASEVVRYAVERYTSHPVVAENPRVRDRFGVLMRYTTESSIESC